MFDLNTSTVTSSECADNSILSVTVQSGVLLWVALDGVLFVVIVSGNLVTLYVLCSSLQYSHTVSNRFVLSLAVSDAMLGFTLLYHMAFYLAPELAACKVTCLLRYVLILLACCASIINVMAIAIDRYFAILHPFKYESAMTNRRAHLALGLGWLLALLIATAPLYCNRWTPTTPCQLHHILPPPVIRTLIAPAFLLVWLTMAVIYWRIWREAVHQAYKLRRGNVSQLRRSCLQVVLTIMATFTLTWLPYLLVICLPLSHPPSATLYRTTLTLAFSSSALNPLIYAWKNSEFKRTFGHMLRCRTASHSLQQERSSIAESKVLEHRSSIVESKILEHRLSIAEFNMLEHRSSIVESKVPLQNEHRLSIGESKILEHRSSIAESKMLEHRSSIAESKMLEHRSSITESKVPLHNVRRLSIAESRLLFQNEHCSSIAESKMSEHRSSSVVRLVGLHLKPTPERETVLLQPDV